MSCTGLDDSANKLILGNYIAKLEVPLDLLAISVGDGVLDAVVIQPLDSLSVWHAPIVDVSCSSACIPSWCVLEGALGHLELGVELQHKMGIW